GVHYGKVPGVDKDFLWKSGAELLAALFSFGVRGKRDKDLSMVDRSAELIEITYEATVFSRQTGAEVWAADGFASSAEKCFRARVCPKCKVATRSDRDQKGMRYCPSCHWEGDEKECGDGLANDFGTSTRNVCARAEKRAKVRAIAEAAGVTGFFLTPQTWEQEEDAAQHGAGENGPTEGNCPTCGKGTLREIQRRDNKGSFWACDEGRYDRQTKKRTGCQHTQNDPPEALQAAETEGGDATPSEDPNAPGTEAEASAVPRVGVATVLDMLLVEGSKGKQMATLAKAAKACGLTISGGDPAKWLEGQTDEDLGRVVDALDAQVTE
ncbi:MAG TPA: hypothetical protein VNA25_22255, partial [Phycisphaerae bacterium]|nr:hypothetical protein [Phycisphaerae bacterium]